MMTAAIMRQTGLHWCNYALVPSFPLTHQDILPWTPPWASSSAPSLRALPASSVAPVLHLPIMFISSAAKEEKFAVKVIWYVPDNCVSTLTYRS